MVYFIINGWISYNNVFKYYSICQHKRNVNSCHILHDLNLMFTSFLDMIIFSLFTCGLCNGAVSSSDYVMTAVRVMGA